MITNAEELAERIWKVLEEDPIKIKTTTELVGNLRCPYCHEQKVNASKWGNSFHCRGCGKGFFHELPAHKKDKTDPLPPHCSVCGKQMMLVSPEMKHHTPKRYQGGDYFCPSCSGYQTVKIKDPTPKQQAKPEACETCRYYRTPHPAASHYTGYCCRMPAAANITSETYWCGEYDKI
jgi:hypothetical protein